MGVVAAWLLGDDVMNGMKRKAERIRHAARYTSEGLPRNANEWTVADWADLWRAMQNVKRKVKARHKCQGK